MLRTTYPTAQHISEDLNLQAKHTICLLVSYHQLDLGEADTISIFSNFSFCIWQGQPTLFLCKFSLPSVYFCSWCPQFKGRALYKAIWHIFRDSLDFLPSSGNKIPDTVRSDLASHNLKFVYTKFSMFWGHIHLPWWMHIPNHQRIIQMIHYNYC